MDLIPVSKSAEKSPLPLGRDTSGIALFMVISAVGVLAILVTEFTYIAQISQAIAFGGLDQAKAHYLAKSGFKLSLLRLKAYQQAQSFLGKSGDGGGIPGIPKALINKIWNFPFYYPIPTNLPGIGGTEKEAIEKFQKSSALEGSFSATIISESSKYNLNSILKGYTGYDEDGKKKDDGGNGGGGVGDKKDEGGENKDGKNNTASPPPSFDPNEARNGLYNYIGTLITQESEEDSDFATNFRDLKLDDLVDNLIAWADRTYDRRTSNSHDKVQIRRAPFSSLSELHMIPNLDDDLYQFLAPHFTASLTPGVNVNTAPEELFRALIPQIRKEEAKELIKYRDNEEADNQFKNADDFYSYLSKNIAAFKGNAAAIDALKDNLAKRRLRIVTDEKQFKITVQAKVNSAQRTIEAWVILGNEKKLNDDKQKENQPPPLTPPVQQNQNPSGIRVTYMRIY